MLLEEYQKYALRTAQYPEQFKITYPALGLSNEAGEVLGKIKKCLRDNNGEFTDEWKLKIADEIGDTLWYLAVLAEDLGFELSFIAHRNLAKLKDRENRGKIKGDGDYR